MLLTEEYQTLTTRLRENQQHIAAITSKLGNSRLVCMHLIRTRFGGC